MQQTRNVPHDNWLTGRKGRSIRAANCRHAARAPARTLIHDPPRLTRRHHLRSDSGLDCQHACLSRYRSIGTETTFELRQQSFKPLQLGVQILALKCSAQKGIQITRSEEHTSELQSLMRIS